MIDLDKLAEETVKQYYDAANRRDGTQRIRTALQSVRDAVEAEWRERLHQQVVAQQEYAAHFDADIRAKFDHEGWRLPKIDGPIEQAVRQYLTVRNTELASLRAEVERLRKIEDYHAQDA